MTKEEEQLVQTRQALNLEIQSSILRQMRILSIGYFLIFLIGVVLSIILWNNKATNIVNGTKLDRMIEALEGQQTNP